MTIAEAWQAPAWRGARDRSAFEAAAPPKSGRTLLLYAPVPLFRDGSAMLLEDQAANGIRLWAENFDHVTVVMPLAGSRPGENWAPVQEAGLSRDRIRIEPVPSAYRPDVFLRTLPWVRKRLRTLIAEADYMSFAIGGLFGDWGAVAAIEAHRMGRPFAAWTDRVESEVVRRTGTSGSLKTRLRAGLTHRPMAWLERFVIRRAALGLFHGRETFDAYSPYCRNPHIVHDIHVAKSDHLDRAAVGRKVSECSEGPLKLCYVGRADAMKGPLDWVATLEALARGGVDFRAAWLGTGELFEQLKSRIELSGLADRVSTPGFVTDRAVVLGAMRDAHAFLFCHLTPESPRCLIEALVSACPLVGYRSAFPEELIEGNGGGGLTALGDTAALAQMLTSLARDRTLLGRLIARAALDGAPFDDVSVFRHRSDLIKTHLSPPGLAEAHG